MAITIQDTFHVNAPKSADSRYLKNGNTPYSSVADANATILSFYRHVGLTVLIGTQEYWYKTGTANGNLILKDTGGATPINPNSPITYNTSTGDIAITQANSGQNGYLSNTDWSTFNSKIAAVGFKKAGSLLGTRKNVNFIEGTNVTLSVADNSGTDTVDITINSSGSGSNSLLGTLF
jgi:hypothetical protein